MELLSRRTFAQAAAGACIAGLTASHIALADEAGTDAVTFEGIKPHHVMCCVKNMDEAVHLWQDVMDLTLKSRIVISSDAMWANEGIDSALEQGLDELSDLTEIATLDNGMGVLVELCHPIVPAVSVSPAADGDYGHTGQLEWAFLVDDIYRWYDKIVEAGYRPQTEPWQAGANGLTFVFYDTEGNMVQLWQYIDYAEVTEPLTWSKSGAGDVRTEAQIAICQESYVVTEAAE